MASDPSAPDAWSRHLSHALRAVRRARQLSAIEVARRMGLPRRTYGFFEAGGGCMNIARIMEFARVTESDPYAIVASVMIGSPALAVRTMDNKILMAFAILLQEFNADVGDDVRQVETSAVISAFSAAFKSFSNAAAARSENSSTEWLNAGASKLGLPRRTSEDV